MIATTFFNALSRLKSIEKKFNRQIYGNVEIWIYGNAMRHLRLLVSLMLSRKI